MVDPFCGGDKKLLVRLGNGGRKSGIFGYGCCADERTFVAVQKITN
jgi:hypothetical protein